MTGFPVGSEGENMSEYLGKNTFKLGFGLMRLPKNPDGSIDIDETLL